MGSATCAPLCERSDLGQVPRSRHAGSDIATTGVCGSHGELLIWCAVDISILAIVAKFVGLISIVNLLSSGFARFDLVGASIGARLTALVSEFRERLPPR